VLKHTYERTHIHIITHTHTHVHIHIHIHIHTQTHTCVRICCCLKQTRSSSSSRSVPFFGSSPPSAVNAKPPSPPPPPATSPQGFGSGLQAQAAGLKWLAAMIASNYTGMGKSAADVLPGARWRSSRCCMGCEFGFRQGKLHVCK